MKIYILADRKIEDVLAAEHLFKDERIIDRVANLIKHFGKHDVFVVSNRKIDVKNVSLIGTSEIGRVQGGVIDLANVYDFRKLQKLILKGKADFEKAVMFKAETKKDLDYFGCFYQRSEWNPIAQYYTEIWAEKLALWLKPTFITPNMVTSVNIILGIAVTGLLFLQGNLGPVIFGLWMRIYHLLDAADGQLARLQARATKFGKWLDCGGDRLVNGVWYIGIAYSLYFKEENILFLFVGFLAIFGIYMQNHLLWTSVVHFRDGKAKLKSSSRLRSNPLSKVFLFFLNGDVHYHMITLFGVINRLDIFLFFYAVYYNIVWAAYFLFYWIQYLKYGDVKEE